MPRPPPLPLPSPPRSLPRPSPTASAVAARRSPRHARGLVRLATVLFAGLGFGILLAPSTAGPAAAQAAAAGTAAEPAAKPAAETDAELRIETGTHAGPVRGIAIDASGTLAITVSDDKTARIWQLADGRLRHVLRPAGGPGRTGLLYGVAAHPAEDLVAIAGAAEAGSSRILLFGTSTGEFRQAIEAGAGEVTRLLWTHDGRALLASYRNADGGDGGALRAFRRDGTMIHETRFAQPGYGLAVSPTGDVAASSYDGQVHLFRYDGTALRPGLRIRAPAPAPRGVDFSPDGSRLAIGYRGVDGRMGAPTVHDAADGSLLFALPRPRLEAGNLANVAFSRDGRLLHAGGSGYPVPGRHEIERYDLATRQPLAAVAAATNTITDLVALPDGGVAFASFDGSWGKVGGSRPAVHAPAALADMRGARNLLLSEDGLRVGIRRRLDDDPQWFDVGRRLALRAAPPTDLRPPRTDGVDGSGRRAGDPAWENTRTPQVDGSPVALATDEISRAFARLPGGGQALLGTSRRLLRVDAGGRVRWQATTPAEVWSVNVDVAGRMAVTALADGTIRWWRASDGALLLSLLMLADGRWLLWNPAGYFDAGPGADNLAGWAVNRRDAPLADFHSLNRFRERFNRPDIVDRLFATLDPRTASPAPPGTAAEPPSPPSPPPVAAAPPVTAAPPATAPSPTPAPPAATAPAARPIDRLPPVISGVGPPRADPAREVLAIPFTVRGEGDIAIEVRIDGRPAPDARTRLADGGGEAQVRLPPKGSLIQLFARDANGVSEPLGVQVVATEAPAGEPPRLAPVPPVAIAPSATPPPSASPPTSASPPPSSSLPPSASPPPPAPPPPAAPARPRLFVLAIGISQYRMPQYRLGLPAKDAKDFVDMMKTQQGRLYDTVSTRLLTDANAGRAPIEQAFEWLRASVGPDDVGILFMAGHGISEPGSGYFFLPWDGDHRALAQTSVPEQSIRKTLSQIRGKALLFVDTCNAGGAVGTFKSSSRELARLANDLASSENGVIVFASSTGRQLSEESDAWGNGAFTKAVLEGLGGKADFQNAGRVTFKGLDFYVSDQVNRLTEGRQTPVTISPSGVPDFALSRIGAI